MDLWKYIATVSRVVDGDTVDLDVDLGFTVHVRVRFRLLGIDTPEVRGIERPDGLRATARAMELLPVGSRCYVESYGTGKYGRWLGVLYPAAEDGSCGPTSVNQLLLDEGLASPYPT